MKSVKNMLNKFFNKGMIKVDEEKLRLSQIVENFKYRLQVLNDKLSYEIKEKLKVIEENTQLKNQIKSHEGEVKELEDDFKALSEVAGICLKEKTRALKEVEELKEGNKVLSEVITEQEEEINYLEKELKEVEEEKNKAIDYGNELLEKIDFLNECIKGHKDKTNALYKEIKKLNEEIENLRYGNSKLKDKREELEETIQKMENIIYEQGEELRGAKNNFRLALLGELTIVMAKSLPIGTRVENKATREEMQIQLVGDNERRFISLKDGSVCDGVELEMWEIVE